MLQQDPPRPLGHQVLVPHHRRVGHVVGDEQPTAVDADTFASAFASARAGGIRIVRFVFAASAVSSLTRARRRSFGGEPGLPVGADQRVEQSVHVTGQNRVGLVGLQPMR